MDLEAFWELAESGTIVLSRHADEMRMNREISFKDIHSALRGLDVIEFYPDAYPHPALLIFGHMDSVPIHVVAGFDFIASMVYIITVYFPDEKHFEPNLRMRRPT